MRFRIALAVAVGIALATPARASEPGQPLDCSDWVFLEPGHDCSAWVPFPCDPESNPFCGGSAVGQVFDNAGRLFRTQKTLSYRVEACGGLDRLEVLAYDGTTATVVGFLMERCNGNLKDGHEGSPASIVFDPSTGRLMQLVVQGHPVMPAAALDRGLAARVVHQDAAHLPRSGCPNAVTGPQASLQKTHYRTSANPGYP